MSLRTFACAFHRRGGPPPSSYFDLSTARTRLPSAGRASRRFRARVRSWQPIDPAFEALPGAHGVLRKVRRRHLPRPRSLRNGTANSSSTRTALSRTPDKNGSTLRVGNDPIREHLDSERLRLGRLELSLQWLRAGARGWSIPWR